MAPSATTGNRPRPLTILAAAFLAGGAAAVGLNHFLDVHLSQRKPVVESEPIFIAMRSLPTGAPITVWDVALRNWPKAMLPTTAMRVEDSFDGMRLKMPLREGQPLLSVQLEPLMAGGKTGTVADTGSGDGGVIVVDDRTKVQVSWPAAAARKPAVSDAARTTITAPSADSTSLTGPATDRTAARPVDDRFAIRPRTPAKPAAVDEAAAVQPVDAGAVDAGSAQQPSPLGATVAQAEVVAEPTPPPFAEPVVPLPAQAAQVAEATVAASEPSSTPDSEQLPEVQIPPTTPSLAVAEELPVVPPPQAALASVLQQQPAAVAATPTPVVPEATATVHSRRHLVVPERIAVMVDEVTAPASQRQDVPAETDNLDLSRKLTPQSSQAPRPPVKGSATAPLQTRLSNVAARPNPLRSQTSQSAVAPRQPTGRTQTQPAASRPQAAQSVPRVAFPQAAATPPQTTGSDPQATDEGTEARMFPRVSARMEKAGEDWNRFRQSLFGSSQE